jgi:Uma2 family endonuclease
MIVHFLYGLLSEQVDHYCPNWFVANYVVGVSPKAQKFHYPDLSVIEIEYLFNLDRNNIIPGQRPLRLAVEVVRPRQRDSQQDYNLKKLDYASLGIPEYWIVDPQEEVIAIHQLVNGHYRPKIFQDNEKLISPTFPKLRLTVAQLLSASLT